MASPAKSRVIALEEHYLDAEAAARFTPTDMGPPALRPSLDDLGERRLREMDEAGIDLQVISHGAPALQRVDDASAVDLARRVNDRLHAAVRSHPRRFAAFAALPTAEPGAAADELERCVTKLGFCGAMLHGIAHGRFLDDRRFWPVFERAQALEVPVYVHPATPHPAVIDAYYRDYATSHPGLVTAAWGFTVETATQGIRLVLSGLFDALPRLQLILGHLGESLPFSLWRIDKGLSRHMGRPSAFRDCFREHFHVTTSGNFSTPALQCCIAEMGVGRILFSVDWPYASNTEAVEWMRTTPLADADRSSILGSNAARLLRLPALDPGRTTE
jgi:predicted TIM-barrel fold metal-dependent hydrolase